MKVFRGTILLLLAAFILLMELGCGDQYRPVANPIIGPGGQPQSTHFAYVVNYNPNGNGSTTTIDVSGDSVSWVQTLGVGSIYEALLPSSTALFIANSGNDTVSDFSAFLNGAVTTVGLLPGSHPVFLTATQTHQHVRPQFGHQFDVSDHRLGQHHPDDHRIGYDYRVRRSEPGQHGAGGRRWANLRPEPGRQHGPGIGLRFSIRRPWPW